MAKNAYPVLCGGTFFTLLLDARKARSGKKTQLYGKRDGLTEPETLAGLVRVMYPEFKEPSGQSTFRTNTAEYKACKNNGGNLPFFDDVIGAFDNCVKSDYKTAFARMSRFVDQYIEVGGSVKKDERLVKALLDLIESDQSIDDTDVFFVCDNGSTVTKAALRTTTDICFPAFLLGVWHFVVFSRRSNMVGAATFNEWCPPNNQRARVYSGNMGECITRTINITDFDVAEPLDVKEAISEDEPTIEFGEPHVEDATDDVFEKVASQTLNNSGFIFQQFGANNKQIVGIIETLVIHND